MSKGRLWLMVRLRLAGYSAGAGYGIPVARGAGRLASLRMPLPVPLVPEAQPAARRATIQYSIWFVSRLFFPRLLLFG